MTSKEQSVQVSDATMPNQGAFGGHQKIKNKA